MYLVYIVYIALPEMYMPRGEHKETSKDIDPGGMTKCC